MVGTYVSIKPTESTKRTLLEVIEASNLSGALTEDELHLTLMYSKEDGKGGNIFVDPTKVFSLEFKEANVLGKALVLLFHPSEELIEHFNRLKIEQNLEHSFDDLLPHVSVKYYENINNAREDRQKLITGLNLHNEMFGKKLFTFFRETAEPLRN